MSANDEKERLKYCFVGETAMNRFILKHRNSDCFDIFDSVDGGVVNLHYVDTAMIICEALNKHDKRSRRVAQAVLRKAREKAFREKQIDAFAEPTNNDSEASR